MRTRFETAALIPGIRTFVTALLLLCAAAVPAVEHGTRDFLKKGDDWFATDEGTRIAANILSNQAKEGGWPKNQDNTKAFTGDPKELHGTFDNGATTDELRFLARSYRATNDNAAKAAFVRGFDHILNAQYPTGGWPQYYPPSAQYHRHITFNDNAMVRLMEFLREAGAAGAGGAYELIDDERKSTARKAFNRGIECILKCQIKVDGKLTVWCAQHDEIDCSPRPGRKFELASLSASESVGIVRLLMSLDHPSPEVTAAVDAAAAWFEAAKLKGIRVVAQDDPAGPKGKNLVVVDDPNAPPMWARFNDIHTNKPIFADRDAVPKAKLSEIGYERRNGYAWLGYWPQKLLDTEYPAWKAK